MASSQSFLQKIISRLGIDSAIKNAFNIVLEKAVPMHCLATEDQAISGGTAATSTYLQILEGFSVGGNLPLEGGKQYIIEGLLRLTFDATGTINFAGGTATLSSSAKIDLTSNGVSYDMSTISLGISSANYVVSGYIDCTSSGTFALQFVEDAGGNAALQKGSWLKLTQVLV